MIFYIFDDNTFATRGYTWAMSLKPRPEEFSRRCPKCRAGMSVEYPKHSINLAVEGGSKYPDILGCGAETILIVSQNVINDWEGAGITGYEKYDVNIVEAKGKRIKDAESPRYYHINVIGRAEYDMEAMGFKCQITCEYCGRIEVTNPNDELHPLDPTIIKEGSWDGSDIFAMDITPRKTYCMEKVLFLAGINERTNFYFAPLELTGDVNFRGLDYRSMAKKMARNNEIPLQR